MIEAIVLSATGNADLFIEKKKTQRLLNLNVYIFSVKKVFILINFILLIMIIWIWNISKDVLNFRYHLLTWNNTCIRMFPTYPLFNFYSHSPISFNSRNMIMQFPRLSHTSEIREYTGVRRECNGFHLQYNWRLTPN